MKSKKNRDATRAKSIFERFFKEHPKLSNPTDINSFAKYQFWQLVGYEDLEACQWFRKANTEKNGWPAPWSRRAWWEEAAEGKGKK